MIEINLVPDVKQELIKAQRVRATVISSSIIIAVGAAGIVTLLAIYAFGVQFAQGIVADGDIQKGSNQLEGVQDLSKTLTIQNQLTKISALHDQENIDSRIFDVLAAIIPPSPNNVAISDASVDSTTSTITIDGQAANSYAAVEVFKKTIEGASVQFTDSTSAKQQVTLASNLSTGNTSYGEDSTGAKVLRFTLSFTYAPELFAPSSKNATVVISANGNATDSYLGVPTSIFADRASDLTTGGQ
jgi:Tfp pilus assembly protein PilN